MKDTISFNLYFQINCVNTSNYITLKLYTYLNSVALHNEKNNSAFIQNSVILAENNKFAFKFKLASVPQNRCLADQKESKLDCYPITARQRKLSALFLSHRLLWASKF